MTVIKRGMQIVYVPRHALGDMYHPDAERGFVTSIKDNVAFCRYWHNGKVGEKVGLRTTANSEATHIDDLVLHDSRPQFVINKLLEAIEADGHTEHAFMERLVNDDNSNKK